MTVIDAATSSLGDDLARVDRETADLISSVAAMTVGDLAEPSRCPGWTRAHVLAHVARNADGMVNLVAWATTGVETPQYPSAAERNAQIERDAARSLQDLREDLAASAERCRDAFNRLNGELTAPRVRRLAGDEISARDLPQHRINELVIHHFDLRTKWTLDDAAPRSLLGALETSVRRLTAHPDTPSLILRLDDGVEYAVGPEPGEAGPTIVRGSRAALVAWLTRGVTTNVRAEAQLPELPSWG